MVERLLDRVSRSRHGPLDVGVITPNDLEEGGYFLGKLRPRLCETGVVWIVLPKTWSGAPEGMEQVSARLSGIAMQCGFIAATPAEVRINDDLIAVGFSPAVP
ncbi:MAG: hypothetical protein ACE5HE_11115 [Phycisphaerae bacterium]